MSINNSLDNTNYSVLDITNAFENVKLSTLKKAVKVSGSINSVTIGPNAVIESSCKENIENVSNNTNNNNKINESKSQESSPATDSSRGSIRFSIKKILVENELQRKEEVRKSVEKRKEEMERASKAFREEMLLLREILTAKKEQERAAELARLEADEERLAQQDEIKRRHAQQLHAQRLQERKERFEREAQQHQALSERKALITSLDEMFKEKIKSLCVLSSSSKDHTAVAQALAPFVAKFRELHKQIESVNEKARRGELNSADVTYAENIVQQADEIFNLSKIEINRIDALYDEEVARREQDVKQAEAHAYAQAEAEAAKIQAITQAQAQVSEQQKQTGPQENLTEQLPDTPPSESNFYEDQESLQILINATTFLNRYAECYQNFLLSPETKRFRFECQKAINIPVNTISAASGSDLMDKYNKLRLLLQGNTNLNINQYPESVAYCKNLLAKNIVNQGETLVSSKPEMAFGVAAVTVALCCDFPDLMGLLLAHFRTICPYICPVYLSQLPGQSNEDYYKSIGYKYIDGVIERQDKFLCRISGIMRLYSAIIVTNLRRGVNCPHPHGLQNAWRWLAATLNIAPKTKHVDAIATLIYDILQVCGNAMFKAYPTQFLKLLRTLNDQYYPLLQQSGVIGGPISRLEAFLRTTLATNSIPVPEGQLPLNMW
ncbi:mRNA export factor GLE1 [Microplitis demolitor]|uniref:mRNA export factor GLE1 n=1 Tax=Microplitis demolitor TaxID=69319 RepID=UPI0004CCE93E|nr:mRNA export factor GLE1 [Microplitis demolitor]